MNLFRSVIPPLISTALIMVGVGFLGTFLVVSMYKYHAVEWEIGLLGSAHYLGMLLGSFRTSSLIIRIGHIRAYAASAAIICFVVLAMSLHYNFVYWVILRIILGLCLGCLFVVIESWLLNAGKNGKRGTYLAAYMIALYGSNALGQPLLKFFAQYHFEAFIAVGMVAVLSIVPLALSGSAPPSINEEMDINLKKLLEIRPSGVVSCFLAGIFLSIIYSLLPSYVTLSKFGSAHISTIMFAVIMGGMLFQYPIGYISDKIDRRYALITISAGILLISLMILLIDFSIDAFTIMMFFLGGLAFTIYPVSINQACDFLAESKIVGVTQGLLFYYGLGAIIGPLIAPPFMSVFGAPGVFILYIIVAACLTLFLYTRIKTQEVTAVEDQNAFVAIPVTTPITGEIIEPVYQEQHEGEKTV